MLYDIYSEEDLDLDDGELKCRFLGFIGVNALGIRWKVAIILHSIVRGQIWEYQSSIKGLWNSSMSWERGHRQDVVSRVSEAVTLQQYPLYTIHDFSPRPCWYNNLPGSVILSRIIIDLLGSNWGRYLPSDAAPIYPYLPLSASILDWAHLI